MKLWLGFALISLIVANPDEDGEHYEGDMILTQAQKKYLTEGSMGYAATTNKKWPTTIPYNYSATIAKYPEAKAAMDDAIKEYEAKTCLKFVRRTTEREYMYFVVLQGCFSGVGKCYYGPCRISLGPGCWKSGVAVHEIAHRLGFYHEQSRPDRDSYIKIHWANIRNGTQRNFVKQPASNIDSMRTKYDYGSVLHYSSTAFGDGKITMEAHDPDNTKKMGQRKGLSDTDALQVNLIYNCPGYTMPPPVVTNVSTTARTTLNPKNVLIDISSVGYSDRCFSRAINPCTSASLKLNGIEYSHNSTGVNVAAFNYQTGVFLSSKVFDSAGERAQAYSLSAYIFDLPVDTLVMLAVQGDALINSDVIKRNMSKIGQQTSLKDKGSYALLGYRGYRNVTWVEEKNPGCRRGPSRITKSIKLGEYTD